MFHEIHLEKRSQWREFTNTSYGTVSRLRFEASALMSEPQVLDIEAWHGLLGLS